jgi:hypothetical protein
MSGKKKEGYDLYESAERFYVDESSFDEKIDANLYFTVRGCEEEGEETLPKWVVNFIQNVAGLCTDVGETGDFYKNPRAMFVALDLIYTLLEEQREDGHEQEAE